MIRQAEHFIQRARHSGLAMNYLISDRDSKFDRKCDKLFKDTGCRVIRSGPRAPRKKRLHPKMVRFDPGGVPGYLHRIRKNALGPFRVVVPGVLQQTASPPIAEQLTAH